MNLKDIADDAGAILEKRPYLKAGLRGAAVGAGAYSVVGLVKEIKDLLEDRKKKRKRENPQISDNTIVLNIPARKAASARDSFIDVDHDVSNDESEENRIRMRQARNADGTFSSGWEFRPDCESKCAQDNSYPRETYEPGLLEGAGDKALGFALAVGGVGAGWHGAAKLHDYLKKKRLKREIAAAQQEYIDFLMGDNGEEKTAQAVPLESVTPMQEAGPVSKVINFVGDITPAPVGRAGLKSTFQNTVGLTGGLALLIMAASSYITKKFMDKKFNDAYNAKTLDDSPKVDRIVVKTAEAESIEMTPADALAFVKFASILMEAESPWFEYENAAAAVEKKAGMEKDALLPLAPLLGSALENNPTVTKYWAEHASPEKVIDKAFDSIGLGGDDPSAWTYDPSKKTQLTGQQLEGLRAAAPSLRGNRDALLKSFMSDRYRPQREFLAQKTIDDWYDRNIGSNDFLHNNFGQWLKPLVGWLGKTFAGTSWGKNMMFNKMYNGVLNQVTPGTNEFVPQGMDAPAAGKHYELVPGTGGDTGYPARYIQVDNSQRGALPPGHRNPGAKPQPAAGAPAQNPAAGVPAPNQAAGAPAPNPVNPVQPHAPNQQEEQQP